MWIREESSSLSIKVVRATGAAAVAAQALLHKTYGAQVRHK